MVLVGIGIQPDDALANAAGLEVENGIRVDALGRTSDPRIFAAGDCTSFPYRGGRVRLESVPNAIDQAEAVAAAMLGDDAPYVARPWFWSDQYDVKLQIAGLNAGYDRTVTRPGARPGSQSVWYYVGDRLLSVDAMNDPRAYMTGKRWIEAGHLARPRRDRRSRQRPQGARLMRIIGGRHRGLALAGLGAGDPAAHLRPTSDRVRESLFNLLAHGDYGDPPPPEARRVLDLFAGTGALGARGAVARRRPCHLRRARRPGARAAPPQRRPARGRGRDPHHRPRRDPARAQSGRRPSTSSSSTRRTARGWASAPSPRRSPAAGSLPARWWSGRRALALPRRPA